MGYSLLSILNTCFWVCLVFAVFFFILSIVLFFVLDIKKIFSIRTGLAQAKTVKEMQQANESTGRLRVNGKTQTSKLTEKTKAKGRVPAVVPPTNEERAMFGQNNVSNVSNVSAEGAEATTVLSEPEETLVPQPQEYAETSVLSPQTTDEFAQNTMRSDMPRVELKIIKKEIFIHTNEMIV